MVRMAVILLSVVLLLSSCAVKYGIQGEYYMQQKDFEGGRETFEKALKEDPDHPQVLHFYGRFLLAENQAKAALPYLEKAVVINPNNSDYQFWLGIAYGDNALPVKERESYEAALRLNQQNVQALTCLGNNLLQAGEYTKSFSNYQQALDIWPENPQALYNRALILRKLNRDPEEKLAWKLYLQSFSEGGFARLATDRLNSLGDFSYRNYQLAARTLTLAEISFTPFSATLSASSQPSLDLLGATVANMDKGILQVIVYQQNNQQLAKMRATSIRDYLLRQFPQLQAQQRIRISWFAVPEELTILDKKLIRQESVQFFLFDPGMDKEEAIAIPSKNAIPQKKVSKK